MWRAVLDGEQATEARARVEAICASLPPPVDASLANGAAGYALLHGERARLGIAGADEQAFAALESALATIEDLASPWLFAGVAGVGLAMQLLTDVVGEHDETLAQLDDVIRQLLATEPWTLDWEHQAGAVGLGVYGLERGDDAMVARAVAILAARAERRDDGVLWLARDVTPDRAPYVNLGIAHGVAGALAFLARVVRERPHVSGARTLLIDGVRWLSGCARERTPRYPMWIELARPSSRTVDGWCYGDPSTAVVLAMAADALGDDELRAAGRTLARHSAARTDGELAALDIDGGLCHGAAGQGWLHQQLAAIDGEAAIVSASRRWFARAMREAPPAHGGVQDGAGGVALALLAAVSDRAPSWTRAFGLA